MRIGVAGAPLKMIRHTESHAATAWLRWEGPGEYCPVQAPCSCRTPESWFLCPDSFWASSATNTSQSLLDKRGEADKPVFPQIFLFALLGARRDACFISVLRILPQITMTFQGQSRVSLQWCQALLQLSWACTNRFHGLVHIVHIL